MSEGPAWLGDSGTSSGWVGAGGRLHRTVCSAFAPMTWLRTRKRNETVCVLSFAHEVVQERLAADATPFVSCKSSRILAVRASWTVNAVAVY